ncbi:DNA-directed RNA polymerase [Roseibium alexandrii]|uniref:DNA-directed RNA polymerase n=1 Tax=Roseibium alexandrii (strain DSM 17067 / NCIMB 14079 / DFL-11) TaxID=244592 RepID=A0A5E8GV83_ROSAD|nr:DNA-directed RNA polymerase [Roseibium alexandrii]EEE42836.1 DNA-directed RNA polymerase [Roseibium alexandrii DFL-11]
MTHVSKDFDGGYYMIQEDIMRCGIFKHSGSNPNAISDDALRTLNALGATPKRINQRVFAVLNEAWMAGDQIAGLPSAHDPVVPGRKEDEEWEDMSKDEQSEHKASREEAHMEIVRLGSSRKQFLDKLSVAREMADHPEFYEPFFLDFRGRFYPMCETFHSQGDDVCKGLIEFARGKPLGSRGLYWLAVRAANCFGEDKLPLDERYQWTLDHLDQIIECAMDPLDGSRWWTQADEPWGFLATCFELDEATALGDRSVEYVSHLAIPLDGSCNGLQHLSAMSKDPVGAKATNLMARAQREDIYLEVAASARRILASDITNGVEWSAQWLAVLEDTAKGRKVVKRAVMTTPYGVTERGIATQLYKDGHVKLLAGYKEMTKPEKWAAASYLKDVIVKALSETIAAAKQVMAWIQTCAEKMADQNVPLVWKTPNNNLITQSYFNLARSKVKTLYGEQVLWSEDPLSGLNPKKQALASAPNLIHSFDAAHLSRTVNALADAGNSDFLMIHDSFGVHACDTDQLALTLRKEFVDIYSTNWLDTLHETWAEACPSIPHWKEFLGQGDFDVAEVLRSDFFFS